MWTFCLFSCLLDVLLVIVETCIQFLILTIAYINLFASQRTGYYSTKFGKYIIIITIYIIIAEIIILFPHVHVRGKATDHDKFPQVNDFCLVSHQVQWFGRSIHGEVAAVYQLLLSVFLHFILIDCNYIVQIYSILIINKI